MIQQLDLIQQLDRYRTPPSWHPGSAWRVLLLRAFGAWIGSGCRIKPGLRVKFPRRLQVNQACWLAEDVWIDNLAPVVLGDRVGLSQGAYLCAGNHDFCSPGFDLLLGPITIGSVAWIAARAVLAPGSQIGPGAVVALGAVVSGTVRAGAHALVAGMPLLTRHQRRYRQAFPGFTLIRPHP